MYFLKTCTRKFFSRRSDLSFILVLLSFNVSTPCRHTPIHRIPTHPSFIWYLHFLHPLLLSFTLSCVVPFVTPIYSSLTSLHVNSPLFHLSCFGCTNNCIQPFDIMLGTLLFQRSQSSLYKNQNPWFQNLLPELRPGFVAAHYAGQPGLLHVEARQSVRAEGDV